MQLGVGDGVVEARYDWSYARCLGCRGQPTGYSRIEVQRGLELGWFSVHASASILAATCTACRWKRRLLGLALVPAPFGVVALVVYVIVKTRPLPGDDDLPWWIAFAFLGGLLALLQAGLRRITPVADRLMWGVHGVRLAKDHSTLVLRVQDAALRHELLELNPPVSAP